MTVTGSTVAGMGCALGAAAAFGVANVIQMRAARRTDATGGIDPRLLARLARDPMWLAGFGASVVGYGGQAVALYLAPVVLVQPLIVAELLFALPLAATLRGSRLRRREWAGALLVAAGLATFVLATHPAATRTQPSMATWLAMTVAAAAVVVALAAAGQAARYRPTRRASLFAAAASVCFGLMSVDTKVVTHQFAGDQLAALGQPQPWLLAVVAIVGLALAQAAFRIAPLSVSLPVIDIGEPLIAVVLAVAAFGERLGTGPGVLAGVPAAGVALVAGVALLDTAPQVRSTQRHITENVDGSRPPPADVGRSTPGRSPA